MFLMAHSLMMVWPLKMTVKITLKGMVTIHIGIMIQEWMTWSKDHGIVSSSKSGMLSILELLQFLGLHLVLHSLQLISWSTSVLMTDGLEQISSWSHRPLTYVFNTSWVFYSSWRLTLGWNIWNSSGLALCLSLGFIWSYTLLYQFCLLWSLMMSLHFTSTLRLSQDVRK